jgi:3-hydroxybutyryl-CoA dehydrogenase
MTDSRHNRSALPKSAAVGVVGAGAMGSGIAQVAYRAGHPVTLYDVTPGAAERARDKIKKDLQGLAAKGRCDATLADAVMEGIAVAGSIEDLSHCHLVVEAVLESHTVKQELFVQLEKIVAEEAILATNTSSISVTSIAKKLRRPERFVGMHFFNPVPVMKLVEVVVGLATSEQVCDAILATAEAWGKIAVRCRSTPGFIVNRVARPYYAEALRLVEEQVANYATIDTLMKNSGGFRMGPFELMDLIGNDVNYTVSKSIFEAFYADARFRPSLLQMEMVDAGWFGRKSGRGFYDYSVSPTQTVCKTATDQPARGGFNPSRHPKRFGSALVALTDGRTAQERSNAHGEPVFLVDLSLDWDSATCIGFTAPSGVSGDDIKHFSALLESEGKRAVILPDWPGLVVMRTVAMLVNEAFEAVMQGVASGESIDLAMRNGVNYPLGPIEWARRVGLGHVVAVIDAIFAVTHDPRYRVSYRLRREALAA